MKNVDNAAIEIIANKIRLKIVQVGHKAGASCHYGGSLSLVEILSTLYSSFVRLDKNDLENRDRVILSKGHGALAMYCILEEMGIMTKTEIDSFNLNGSEYVCHAKRNVENGLEFSGGSLGLGISHGVGVAYACREKGLDSHVYIILGDGECDEGIVWEALMFAKHNNLNNLTIVVDYNHLQGDGFVEDVMNIDSLSDKFTAFGFLAVNVDGHSIQELKEAFDLKTDSPKAIIAETVKGKGVSFMENKYNFHYTSMTESKYNKAISELKK